MELDTNTCTYPAESVCFSSLWVEFPFANFQVSRSSSYGQCVNRYTITYELFSLQIIKGDLWTLIFSIPVFPPKGDFQGGFLGIEFFDSFSP